MRTLIIAILFANAAFAVGVASVTWSKPKLLSRHVAAALQITLLCTTTAIIPPLYNALPESIRGRLMVLSQCVDHQGQTTTSLHPFETCAGQQRKFDTRRMDWVDVFPPGYIIEG
jgi:hypothetical protein